MTEHPRTPETHIAEFAPEKLKVLVFDVDDTVTRGTLGIKIAVWEELFADRLDQLQEARDLYEATGNGDRYNIIAHTIGEPQENCRENPNVQAWADKFEDTTMAKIREGGIHADDLQALLTLKNNFKGAIYLLSATPQAAVEANIKHFEEIYPEIAGMFAGVIGTPMNGGKAGELNNIAKQHAVATDEVLMVGDGGSDYNGATGSGSQFVGVVPSGEKWSDKAFPKVTSIARLPALLKL